MKAILSRNFYELFDLILGIVCYLGWYFQQPTPRKIRKDCLSEYFQYFRAVKWRHIAGYILLPLAALFFNAVVNWFPDSWLYWFWHDYLRGLFSFILLINYFALFRWYRFHYEAKLVGHKVVLERSSRNHLIVLLCLFNLFSVFLIAFTIYRFSIGESAFAGF